MTEPATVTLREPRERVSPNARLMWTLNEVVTAAVVVLVVVATSSWWDLYDLAAWVPWALGVVLLAWVVAVPQWRYAVHRWEVTDSAVYTQTGWWSREQRIAPMSRIQTVDYAEGAIARIFGLASVTVTTASAAGALHIEGLERGRARAVVDDLTVKADAVPGDAT